MNRNMVLGLLAVATSGFSSAALADWTGKGELGGSFASGNSENEAVNAALALNYASGDWKHMLGFAGNYGNDGNVATAQRWELRGQSNYSFTERAYGFGAGRYEDDRFSAYDYQASLAGGLGYRIVDTEQTKFWVQGGPGYRFAKLLETGESEDGADLPWRPRLRPPAHRDHQDRRAVPGRDRLRQHLPAERSRARGGDQRHAGAAPRLPGAAQHQRGARHGEDRHARDGRPDLRDEVGEGVADSG